MTAAEEAAGVGEVADEEVAAAGVAVVAAGDASAFAPPVGLALVLPARGSLLAAAPPNTCCFSALEAEPAAALPLGPEGMADFLWLPAAEPVLELVSSFPSCAGWRADFFALAAPLLRAAEPLRRPAASRASAARSRAASSFSSAAGATGGRGALDFFCEEDAAERKTGAA